MAGVGEGRTGDSFPGGGVSRYRESRLYKAGGFFADRIQRNHGQSLSILLNPAVFAGQRKPPRVHILYLEAPYRELIARNRKRERHIPEQVLDEMIRKLEIPEPWELRLLQVDF